MMTWSSYLVSRLYMTHPHQSQPALSTHMPADPREWMMQGVRVVRAIPHLRSRGVIASWTGAMGRSTYLRTMLRAPRCSVLLMSPIGVAVVNHCPLVDRMMGGVVLDMQDSTVLYSHEDPNIAKLKKAAAR